MLLYRYEICSTDNTNDVAYFVVDDSDRDGGGGRRRRGLQHPPQLRAVRCHPIQVWTSDRTQENFINIIYR